jgi:MFS family permease
VSVDAPTAIEVIPSPRSVRAVVINRTFPALEHRNFRLFFFGQMVSLIGTWTQQVAQGWLVWTIAHSPLALGLVAAVQSIPVLLFGLAGGVVADRMPKRTLLIVTQVASAALALVLAVLVTTQVIGTRDVNLSLFLVGVLAVGLGVVNAFDAPARQAYVVELVGKKHLLNAISLNSSIFNGARILGPATAAVLIATVGIVPAFYLNAASFLPVIVGLYFIHGPHVAQGNRDESMLANLGEALRYVWREPGVRAINVTVVVASLLIMSYISLLPAFADSVLHAGPQGYGALTTAGGLGALTAALSLAVTSNRRQVQSRWIVWGPMAYGLLVALFALSNNAIASAGLLFLAGFAAIGFLARANTALQTAVPDELRGRVMGIYILILIGIAPLGAVQLGALARAIGADHAVAIESLTAVLVLLVLHVARARAKKPLAD